MIKGTNSASLSVSRNGDSGNRSAAGEILPPFLRFKGRVAVITARFGVVAKSSKKALVKSFCKKKLHRIFGES